VAAESVTINAPVGIRKGKSPLPNLPADLAAITDLFDRIAVVNGGTADIAGPWPVDRGALIAEIGRQIAIFQSINPSAGSDSTIDPRGQALRIMNTLAADSPPQAVVDPWPENVSLDDMTDLTYFASIYSMPGSGPLLPDSRVTHYSRQLVRATGTSIKWFGVVVPESVGASVASAIPHIFFTPTPIQGGYSDQTYDSFIGWGQLWIDYTSRIGGLLTASGVNQILVIPFYKTSQAYGLGSFLKNWQQVVTAVITAAVNATNPYYISAPYTFERLYSSSFSNGINAHYQFNSQGIGVHKMTPMVFDLDGQAQTGGSSWRPSNGVIYQNRQPPGGINPHGLNWYVGSRWKIVDVLEPTTSTYSHHACSQYLLFHGLRTYCK
jgi:hypothetical protein